METKKISVEKLLKEIVAAYRATQAKPLDTNEHITHLRYQIARLTRVCIEMQKRIEYLERMQEVQLGGGQINLNGHHEGQEEEDGRKITALGACRLNGFS